MDKQEILSTLSSDNAEQLFQTVNAAWEALKAEPFGELAYDLRGVITHAASHPEEIEGKEDEIRKVKAALLCLAFNRDKSSFGDVFRLARCEAFLKLLPEGDWFQRDFHRLIGSMAVEDDLPMIGDMILDGHVMLPIREQALLSFHFLLLEGVVPETVEYLAGAAQTQQLLVSDPEAIVMTAEPALTAAKMKNEAVAGYAVNDLFKEAAGMDGYAQAALFIKAETIESQPEKVDAFLARVSEAAGKCESDIDAVAEAAAALEILPNAKVAAAAIPGCAIRFVTALDAREQIEKTAEIDLSQYGGGVPSDDFYYGAE